MAAAAARAVPFLSYCRAAARYAYSTSTTKMLASQLSRFGLWVGTEYYPNQIRRT